MKESTLTAIGIDEKAAKIYLTALALGTASVQEIANKAGIKRPTAYLHIGSLLREGLLERASIGKKEYFRASNPNVLRERASQALAHIESALPELIALHTGMHGRPSVRVLEGVNGFHEVYAAIRHANSIRFWSNLAAVENIFAHEINQIAMTIATNGIRTREIIADTPETRRASKRFSAVAGKSYSARIAKKGTIQNDNAIYGDTVALFRANEHNLFVVIIEDTTIATTMRTLFDLAWESSENFIL